MVSVHASTDHPIFNVIATRTLRAIFPTTAKRAFGKQSPVHVETASVHRPAFGAGKNKSASQ